MHVCIIAKLPPACHFKGNITGTISDYTITGSECGCQKRERHLATETKNTGEAVLYLYMNLDLLAEVGRGQVTKPSFLITARIG